MLTGCGNAVKGDTAVIDEQVQVSGDVQHIICGSRIDGTRSESPDQFEKTVENFSGQLATVVETFDCTVLRVSLFSNEAGFALTEEFRMSDEVLKEEKISHDPKRGQITEGTKVAHELEATKTKKQTDKRAGRIAEARAKLVTDARAWIKKNVRLIDSPCTAVRDYVDALNSAVSRAQVDIVISDLRESCNAAPASPLVLQHPFVFVILPSVGEIHDTAPQALKTAKAVDQSYVNAYTMLAYEINSPFAWKEMKKRIASRSTKGNLP